uniref:LysR family transcriptional regulator n=1 Tax=Cupriavidus necator TaxID=106590 RepID=UPI003F496BCE
MSVRDYFSRDVRLRHLRLVVALDDAGQLTKAARNLHVTQPALSKALTGIEQLIGQQLFQRTPKGLITTQAGAAFVRAARAALQQLESAGGEIEDLNAAKSRTVVIGVMPTATMTSVAAAAERLLRCDPQLTIRVVEGGTPMLLPQLADGRLDLVVGSHMRPALPDGVDAIRLYDDLMQPVVSRRHPLARMARPSWGDLVQWPWVLPPTGHNIRILFERALRLSGLSRPASIVEGMPMDLVLAMLESAKAVNLMPGRLAGQLQAGGTVAKVRGKLGEMLDISVPVGIFIREGEDRYGPVDAFIECMHAVLGLRRHTKGAL